MMPSAREGHFSAPTVGHQERGRPFHSDLTCPLRIERRARTPHGEWGAYLGTVGITERSARVYMTMGRQIGSAADLGPSIRATLAEITAVPLGPYENGPGTPCAGMMGLCKTNRKHRGNQARGPQ